MADLDLGKHIAYWREGAEKDFDFANRLINQDKEALYGLFFLHLALEKSFKAVVCKQTGDVPPRTHDLLRLAHLGKIELSEQHSDFLSKMNLYNIEGRYPDMDFPNPSTEMAARYFQEAKEVTEWLLRQL